MNLKAAVGACAWAMALASAPAGQAAPPALPDWSGLWQNQGPPTNTDLFDGGTSEPRGCFALSQPCRSHPPYNAEWEAKYGRMQALARAGTLPDPLTRCMPRGTPGNMRSPDTIEFVLRPERVWIFIENGSQARHIYTDGRGHRTGKAAFDTFTGDSIGRWEGDTLVVETVGVKGDLMIDRSGASLSAKARTTERIRRRDPNTMEDVFTIEDPVALTAPWVVTRLYRRVNGLMYDYACAENPRNTIDASGRTLTLDAHGKVID
ncbi:MAG: hypothetical protein JWO72_936, partial [Caulobacteraceae bacterium]|nr:hypothetical protein [Caulobacteraceae bacterium]